MTTQEIGDKLVAYCRAGEFDRALDELYADDAVHVEAMAMGPHGREVAGLDAIRAMSDEWEKSHEIHGVEVGDAHPHDDRFICTMKIDVTPSEGPMAGQRYTMDEACLYHCAGG